MWLYRAIPTWFPPIASGQTLHDARQCLSRPAGLFRSPWSTSWGPQKCIQSVVFSRCLRQSWRNLEPSWLKETNTTTKKKLPGSQVWSTEVASLQWKLRPALARSLSIFKPGNLEIYIWMMAIVCQKLHLVSPGISWVFHHRVHLKWNHNRRSLEAKLPTIWTDEKQSRAEAERRERLEERRSEKRKSQKKEDADARKGREVAKHCVFPMICGSGGSKSRLAKAAGAEPAGQMRDEKLHAVVARSTFRSQNVQNTRGSDHFWKLRCRKSARRCGAKHISKSKCTKHQGFGPLLEVAMSKKVHAVVARSTFPSQNVQNTRGSDHFWKLRYRKSARRCGAKYILKSKVLKTGGLGPLLEVEMSKKCTPLWREAHFQGQNVQNTRSSDHFWRFRCWKSEIER